MTAITTFSGIKYTHLVADSIVSSIDPAPEGSQFSYKNSTGLLVEAPNFIFEESKLKIAIIGANLAIGYSGSVSSGEQSFTMLNEMSDLFSSCSFNEFCDCLRSVFSSVTPCEGGLQLIGFFVENSVTTKFFVDEHGNVHEEKGKCNVIACGSGFEIFKNIFENKDLSGGYIEQFRKVADPFYENEFWGETRNVTQYKSGGAISGMYTDDNSIKWQDSSTTILYQNISDKPEKPFFKRLQFVYKTWYEDGCMYVSSMLEKSSGEYYQSITMLSNSLSTIEHIDQTNLKPEMKTFESDYLVACFLVKTNDIRYVYIKKKQPEDRFFDEIHENNRIVGWKENREIFTDINEQLDQMGILY